MLFSGSSNTNNKLATAAKKNFREMGCLVGEIKTGEPSTGSKLQFPKIVNESTKNSSSNVNGVSFHSGDMITPKNFNYR
jgi:hypothetical protein